MVQVRQLQTIAVFDVWGGSIFHCASYLSLDLKSGAVHSQVYHLGRSSALVFIRPSDRISPFQRFCLTCSYIQCWVQEDFVSDPMQS